VAQSVNGKVTVLTGGPGAVLADLIGSGVVPTVHKSQGSEYPAVVIPHAALHAPGA
jgi:hypothetical protein